MSFLNRLSGKDDEAEPDIDATEFATAFAKSTSQIRLALIELFREVGGNPPDQDIANEEALAFALTFCTLVVQRPDSHTDRDGIFRMCDRLNSSTIQAFRVGGYIADEVTFHSRFRKRYPEYSGTIIVEILANQEKNKHGGLHFAINAVFTNAYGLEKTKGPLVKILLQLPTLIPALGNAKARITKICLGDP